MYEDDPSFEKPEDENVKIWRYMDFTKFVSMLDTNSLYFAAAEKLDDPLEGVYPLLNKAMFFIMLGDTPIQQKEEIWKQIQDFSRRHIAVNCWHMNSDQSAAMWKLYLKSNEGIAIQSTFARLVKCFSDKSENKVYIGKIKYIDYKTQGLPPETIRKMVIFDPFLYKRTSFEHERELRAAVVLPLYPHKVPAPLPGINIPVDLDILIEKVFVAPTAPVWIKDLVCSLLKKYNLPDKQVELSDLYSGQLY